MSRKFWRGRATVEIPAGSNIDHAARDAIELARLIDGPVHFEFNGVPLMAKPDSDAKEIAGRLFHGYEYEKLAQSLNRAASTKRDGA